MTPPALIILVDGSTDEDAGLASTLERARQVSGVGRVLLFHPPDAESRLVRRALGFRLWPQDGATSGERYANAFRQAHELGYDGAVVTTTDTTVDVPTITEASVLLAENPGAVVGDGQGGIALLALQEPQPTILSGSARLGYDELITRCRQQRVRMVELPALAPSTSGS